MIKNYNIFENDKITMIRTKLNSKKRWLECRIKKTIQPNYTQQYLFIFILVNLERMYFDYIFEK